jgi:glycogen operon protein
MLNMDWQTLDFELPAVEGRHWYRVIDTSAASPADIASPGHEERVTGSTYRVHDRSVAVLISK